MSTDYRVEDISQAGFGHFGRTDDLESLTWEKTDKAAKKAAGA